MSGRHQDWFFYRELNTVDTSRGNKSNYTNPSPMYLILTKGPLTAKFD
jgi:hypothetical protein